MKVGIVILCRYSSSRLYGKILKKINNKCVLEYICEKIGLIKNIAGYCVATSINEDDDAIETYCLEHKINVYRGSLDNVSLRFLKCAEKNDYDAIVRINGDNIFLDIKLIENAIDLFIENNLDFLSNVKGRTYPRGMSIEIVKKDIYKKHIEKFETIYNKEHVMPYFYENDNLFKTNYIHHKNDQLRNIDLALDTEADFQLATKIITNFTKPNYEYTCTEVVRIYKTIKSE